MRLGSYQERQGSSNAFGKNFVFFLACFVGRDEIVETLLPICVGDRVAPLSRMKNCFFLLAILLLALPVQAQPIRVQAARFERRLAFPYGNHNVHLDAHVVLSGSALRAMTGYGHWQISEARDDQGTDLRPTDKWDLKENSEFEGFQATNYTSVSRKTTTFALAPASPVAKKATLVRGTVSVVLGGRQQTLSIPLLTRHFGERLTSPILDAAGVQITLGARDKDHPALFTVEERGNIAALQCDDDNDFDHGKFIDGVGVTDAKGRDVLAQISTPVRSDPKQRSLSALVEKPLDDGMTLHLRVLVGS